MELELTTMRCVSCEGIGECFDEQTAVDHGEFIPEWTRDSNQLISREFLFKNYRDAFAFATRLSLLAEDQGHHPDLEIGWGRVKVSMTTHAVGGLTINDFVMAARIDQMTTGVGLK